MALFHFHVDQIGRSAGRSAVACAAYRSGEKLYSEYYGETSDYTRKGGVMYSEIMLPPHAPMAYADRQTLWNAVEKAERRHDAQLAYSFDIALQNELTFEENLEVARAFLLQYFVGDGMTVDFCVHDPERDGIQNPHFHVMVPIRPLNPDGTWGTKQHRVYHLGENGERIRDEYGNYVFDAVATTDWGKPETLELWRAQWANVVNAKFEQKGLPCRILCCPICGAGMYGNVNRKKKKDGSRYKDYFYYTCKHRRSVDGHVCTYKKQWGEDKVNAAVAEVIKKLVQNPKFEAAIRQKINTRIDTGELEQEIENLRKQLRQVLGAKNKLAQQMDSLDVTDRYYDRKYQDMQDRLDHFYDQIDEIEDSIAQVEVRIQNIRQQKLGSDNVYQYLLYFDKLYDKFTDAEKKEFLSSFVERVDIYEDELPDGRFLRHIRFKFPVFYNGQEIDEMSWDKESTVETVVLMSRK